MKVIVIGGAGYIGSHVVKELVKQECDVYVFDNLSTGLISNIPDDVNFLYGNIQNGEELTSLMKREMFDVVIHLAALKAAGESMLFPEKYSQANLVGSINILNAMVESECKNIVFSSSAAVYGSPQYLPMDEKHPKKPENFYGYTKSVIEDLFEWYGKTCGIHFANLRYFNAAGYDIDGKLKGLEKNPANLIPVVMEVAMGKRKQMDVYGDDYPTKDGTGVRDYVHVNDLANAHYKAMLYLNNKGQSLTVNLGTGNGLSVLEIINITEIITKKEIVYQIKPRRLGDPDRVFASNTLAKELLDWEAKYSDIETIIRTTWDAYNE